MRSTSAIKWTAIFNFVTLKLSAMQGHKVYDDERSSCGVQWNSGHIYITHEMRGGAQPVDEVMSLCAVPVQSASPELCGSQLSHCQCRNCPDSLTARESALL
jgi:hypothetical protein